MHDKHGTLTVTVPLKGLHQMWSPGMRSKHKDLAFGVVITYLRVLSCNTSIGHDLTVMWMWQTSCFATPSCGVRLNSFFVSFITGVLLCLKVIICEVHCELWRVRHSACSLTLKMKLVCLFCGCPVFLLPYLCSFFNDCCIEEWN